MSIEALKLAQEELENCADLLKMFEAPIDSCVGATMLRAEAAITAIKQALAAPVQEFVCSTGLCHYKAQRQWVGLTDAEVMQTMSGDWTSQFYFARAIEAKLKAKNSP